MLVIERLLRHVAIGGGRALRWFSHEFLLLRMSPAAGSRLANLCRLIGCVVIVASLRVELGAGFLPNTTAAVIQVGMASLTAILFGNVAKEFAFDLSARFTTFSGRAFLRKGLTLDGKTFWEIQFEDGTWMRFETKSRHAVCEWTEPDGRCNRLEVAPHDL